MSESLKWWTEERIRYYIDASRNSTFHEELSMRIMRHLTPGERVLDAGCGIAFLDYELRKAGISMVGIDIDEDAINASSKLFPNLDLEKCGYESRKDGKETLLSVFFLNDENVWKMMGRRRKGIVIQKEGRREIMERPGFAVEKEYFELEFPQCARSYQEAIDFLDLTYKKREKRIEAQNDEEFPYLIRNRKKLVMSIIQRRNER